MQTTAQIAKHLRDVYFGGNWTSVCLKDLLEGITWEQAIAPVGPFNTIATLVFHMHYYVEAVTKVLLGGPLDASDKFSFAHPPIRNEADWEQMKAKVWAEMEAFAALVEKVPDQQLGEPFLDGKYGTWYRNLAGIVEHTHYHLGQIALLKKSLIINH